MSTSCNASIIVGIKIKIDDLMVPESGITKCNCKYDIDSNKYKFCPECGHKIENIKVVRQDFAQHLDLPEEDLQYCESWKDYIITIDNNEDPYEFVLGINLMDSGDLNYSQGLKLIYGILEDNRFMLLKAELEKSLPYDVWKKAENTFGAYLQTSCG